MAPVQPSPAVGTVYVSFSAEIVPKTSEALLAVLADQVNRQTKKVHLLLSTPGGSVMNGLNLYNALRDAVPANHAQRRERRFHRQCHFSRWR